MRHLLAEILKYAELEHFQSRVEIPKQLYDLVIPCNEEGSVDYYAVDSGYVTWRIGTSDVLIQSVVAVGKDVKRKFIIQKVSEDPHFEARINELRFAESVRAEVVLVDGPLTPYINTTKVVGVSKDPRLVRYGPRVSEKDKRDVFVRIAKMLGERELASLLLSTATPGSYLLPVDLGDLYGTFFKSDWIVYVEFPKYMDPSRLCVLFKRYPVKLRLAHHLAKTNRQYLKTVKTILSSVLRIPPQPRDLL
jgi:NurA domain.